MQKKGGVKKEPRGQAKTLLDFLWKSRGKRIPLPKIMDLKHNKCRIANYTDVISRLRKLGHIIENKKEYKKGICHSYYRLRIYSYK